MSDTRLLYELWVYTYKDEKTPAYRLVSGSCNLDIHVDGQILPLVAAEVLTVGLFILQRLIETDGKLEI